MVVNSYVYIIIDKTYLYSYNIVPINLILTTERMIRLR
jgi:hypothetical protein